MKNYLILLVLITILLKACKEKKEIKQKQPLAAEPPISALSIIKGQVNKFDSSLYAFTKYYRNDSLSDTTYLKREDVRKFAEPFLSLPEIADNRYHEKYTEDKHVDIERNTLNITSISKSDTAEIQKQIIIVSLSPTENSKVQSIFVDRYIANRDSTIEQKLFLVLDSYFSIQNIIAKENQPEKIITTRITWQ